MIWDTDIVDHVADTLVATAIRHGSQCCWLAPTVEATADGWSTIERTGDATLYDGSAGIALACALAARDRAPLIDTALAGIRHALGRADGMTQTGLYDGRAGVGLAALVVGHESDDRSVTRAGARVIDEIAATVASDPAPANDLVSGLAGIVVALCRASVWCRRDDWVDAAVVAADELVARATRHSWGTSWASVAPGVDDAADLCGLAHGVSGVVLALTLAGSVSGEMDRYAVTIADARRYERSWFDPSVNGWPDLRDWDGTSPPPRPARWCHGAVGIGLSRLALVDTGRPSVLGEVASALQASCADAVDQLGTADTRGTLAHGLSLCHGLGGAIDLLAEATAVLDEIVHLDAARRLTGRALTCLGDDASRWPGGIDGLPSPGLMNGLAGTLLALDRLGSKHDLPSDTPSPGLLGVSGVASAQARRARRSATCAAFDPHMPCTPAPGGVAAEHR